MDYNSQLFQSNPPPVRYQLSSCVWELTRRCNMSCAHCGSNAGLARNRELTLEEALSIANQLLELGCQRVTLIGGEITLCRWWVEVALYLTNHGAVCDIVTNGYGKTAQDVEDIVKSRIASVSISVDGYGSSHNRIRGKEDAFSQLETFCARVRPTGIPLTAVTTLTHPCLSDLDSLCQWLSEQGIVVWQWQQVSPMGRAADKRDLCLTPDDVAWVLEKYLSLKERLPILLADNLGYYYRSKSGEIVHPFFGCGAGLCVVGLDSEGNVRGCQSLYDERFIEGNLRVRSLRDIWLDPESFSYNRQFKPSDLTGKCKSCAYGNICAGGCRSYNAFHDSLYCNLNCAAGFCQP